MTPRCSGPALGRWFCALLSLYPFHFFAPRLLAENSILIPRDDSRWDGDLIRGVEAMGQGDFRSAVEALQGVLDDDASRRSLREVPFEADPMHLRAWILERSADPRSGAIRGKALPGIAPPPFPPGVSLPPGRRPLVPPGLRQFPPARPAAGEEGSAEEDDDAEGNDRPEGLGRKSLHIPVAEVAAILLSGLPAEGLKVYQALYGENGDRLLDRYRSGGERATLERLAERYFLTSAGREARRILGDLLYEEGNLRGALLLWSGTGGSGAAATREGRLRSLHALRQLGRAEDYESERRALQGEAGAVERAQEPGSPRADDAQEVLRAIEAEIPLAPQPDGIALAPGLPLSPPPVFSGRKLALDWQSAFWARGGIAKPNLNRLRSAAGFRNSYSYSSSSERDVAPVFPFHPGFASIGGVDVALINGVACLHRLSIATGKLELEYPLQSAVRSFPFLERSESPIYTVTATGGSGAGAGAADQVPGSIPDQVIGSYLSDLVLYQPYLGYEITVDIPTRSLASFDLRTGRLLWRSDGLKIGNDRSTVSFTTPPLVRGGVLYAAGWRKEGFINSLLVALDLRTGAPLWHQLLVSSQMEGTMFGELAREPFHSGLTERDGVIYALTQLGAVTALEAATGRILWTTTYEAIEVIPTLGPKSNLRSLVWGPNQPLLVGETLIVTPRDSANLYAIDASPAGLAGVINPGVIDAGAPSERKGGPRPEPGSPSPPRRPGRILWQLANPRGDLRDLLGYCAATGCLYFTGPGGVSALDIRGAPEREPRLLRFGELRSAEGRGALTAAGVVVAAPGAAGAVGRQASTIPRLWLVDLDFKGPAVDLTGPLFAGDSSGPGGPSLPGGNVTVARDRVFLTTRDLIACYRILPEEKGGMP